MPTGDIAVRPTGVARVATGVLVQVVPSCGPVGSAEVFTPRELRKLDEVLATAEHATGLRFATCLGGLGDDPRASAEAIIDSFGDDAEYTALVAVSPAQRTVQIVTGAEAALRISERGTRAAVLSVVASCSGGDLLGGLINGVRILTDHAGQLKGR